MKIVVEDLGGLLAAQTQGPASFMTGPVNRALLGYAANFTRDKRTKIRLGVSMSFIVDNVACRGTQHEGG